MTYALPAGTWATATDGLSGWALALRGNGPDEVLVSPLDGPPSWVPMSAGTRLHQLNGAGDPARGPRPVQARPADWDRMNEDARRVSVESHVPLGVSTRLG